MALGTPEGPAGSVGGCILAVGFEMAKDSPNKYFQQAGRWGEILEEARNIQTMRAILRDPAKADQLIRDWTTLLRTGH
jgi:hypothetical protein